MEELDLWRIVRWRQSAIRAATVVRSDLTYGRVGVVLGEDFDPIGEQDFRFDGDASGGRSHGGFGVAAQAFELRPDVAARFFGQIQQQ